MTHPLYKKIVAGILAVTITFSVTGYAFPQKAYAILPVEDVIAETNLFIIATNSIQQVAQQILANSKSFTLDFIATALAKQLLRVITASVVNWINSGFEGSPSFVTNPGSFFLDLADQVTGEYLDQNVGPLNSLCSPFSIDIRLALAFKYHPNIPKRYTCTLGAIIANSKNAVKGATLNGFTAGDFRQGGWPAFVSLTTEPQNNYMGVYLAAESDLSIRVAGLQLQKKSEIGAGQGFLSWQDPSCIKAAKRNSQTFKDAKADSGGETDARDRANDVLDNYSEPLSAKDCPIKTPGSVIAGSLQNSLNGPLRELELVDSINQVVNALVGQLVSTVLKAGLSAVSGSGPSDSTAYIYEIQKESNDRDQVTKIRDELLKNLETYLNNAFQFKTNKNQSLDLILRTKNNYDAVKACYGDKKTTAQPPLTQGQVEYANAKIKEIDYVINSTVAPVATKLLDQTTEANAKYKVLTDIRDKANAAKTVNDLNEPSRKYAQLLQNQSLISTLDVSNSQLEFTETQSSTGTMNQDASGKLIECQIFPNNTRYNTR